MSGVHRSIRWPGGQVRPGFAPGPGLRGSPGTVAPACEPFRDRIAVAQSGAAVQVVPAGYCDAAGCVGVRAFPPAACSPAVGLWNPTTPPPRADLRSHENPGTTQSQSRDVHAIQQVPVNLHPLQWSQRAVRMGGNESCDRFCNLTSSPSSPTTTGCSDRNLSQTNPFLSVFSQSGPRPGSAMPDNPGSAHKTELRPFRFRLPF